MDQDIVAPIADVESLENGVRVVEFDFKGGKRLKMHELNGIEGRALMQICDSTKSIGIDMALMSLVSINGVALPPVVNESILDARAQRFTFQETFALAKKYSDLFGEDLDSPKSEAQ